MKTTTIGSLCLMTGLLLTGCVVGDVGSSWNAKEEFHQTYPLATNGQLSLDNVNGSVRIIAWDRPEVQLDAVKRAKNEDQLKALKIEVETGTGDQKALKPEAETAADRLVIRTKYPTVKHWFGGNSTSGAVDYTLKVPATVRLKDISHVNGKVELEGVRGDVKATTVNGTVRASGLAGNANLSSVNGAVKADFSSLDGVKSVSAETVNGVVDLNLPAGANADLSASTVNGGISGDVPVKKNWPVGAEVNTQLGQGGTKIALSTVNGGVRIHLAKPQ